MITRKYNVEIVPQHEDLIGVYEQSEIGARTCYKSEGVIKYDDNGRSITAKPFVDKLMHVNKHGSIAEHGSIYLKVPYGPDFVEHSKFALVEKYKKNKYSIVRTTKTGDYAYITTNLRVIDQNDWYDDLQFISTCTKYHTKRITVRFHSQCVISREAHRHRTHSPSEQSTRYCNYSKDKFGSEVNISVPEFAEGCVPLKQYNNAKNPECMLKNYCHGIANDNLGCFIDKFDYWLFGNLAAEYAYLGMINCGAVPDEARTVLPLDTHTEFVHTAYWPDWFNFLKLRCAPNAHKDIQVLAYPLKDMLIEQGYFTQEEFDSYDDGWELEKSKY